jgi:hypothetical protein
MWQDSLEKLTIHAHTDPQVEAVDEKARKGQKEGRPPSERQWNVEGYGRGCLASPCSTPPVAKKIDRGSKGRPRLSRPSG